MKLGGTTLIDPEIENILETLRSELEENMNPEDEPVKFEFHIEFYSQEELDKFVEFDGF